MGMLHAGEHPWPHPGTRCPVPRLQLRLLLGAAWRFARAGLGGVCRREGALVWAIVAPNADALKPQWPLGEGGVAQTLPKRSSEPLRFALWDFCLVLLLLRCLLRQRRTACLLFISAETKPKM